MIKEEDLDQHQHVILNILREEFPDLTFNYVESHSVIIETKIVAQLLSACEALANALDKTEGNVVPNFLNNAIKAAKEAGY